MGDALNSLIIQAYKEKCDEAEYWKHLALEKDNKLSVVFHIRDRLQDVLHDLTGTLYGQSTHVSTPILRECKDWSEEDLQQITEMMEQWTKGDEHTGWKCNNDM